MKKFNFKMPPARFYETRLLASAMGMTPNRLIAQIIREEVGADPAPERTNFRLKEFRFRMPPARFYETQLLASAMDMTPARLIAQIVREEAGAELVPETVDEVPTDAARGAQGLKKYYFRMTPQRIYETRLLAKVLGMKPNRLIAQIIREEIGDGTDQEIVGEVRGTQVHGMGVGGDNRAADVLQYDVLGSADVVQRGDADLERWGNLHGDQR